MLAYACFSGLELSTVIRKMAAAVMPVMVAAAMPAHSMTIGQIKVVCPIDGKEFKTWTAFSGTQFGMGLDFKPLGPTPAPRPLAKCPDNGFVIYKKVFSAEEIDRLRLYVKSHEYQAMAKIHTNYFLAAKLKSEMGEPPSGVALTLLKATWEASDPQQYRTYASAALAAYKKVLSTPSEDEDEHLTATLVAGELERRLGLFDKARSRFLGISHRDTLPGVIGQIVKQQLLLIEQANREPAEVSGK